MDIGHIIKKRREELGMSQEELALKAGYKSRSSINKIEVEGRGLPQTKIAAIASALRTTPASLMGWETEGSFVNEVLEDYEKHMLDYLEQLNESGKKEALKRVREMTHIPEYAKAQPAIRFAAPDRSYLEPIAAHERTDRKVTEEMKQHDDAFFDE